MASSRLDKRTYPTDSIRGLPTLSQTLGAGYFSPQLPEFQMPQRNIDQELRDMRKVVSNEIRSQRRQLPKLIDVESQNALKRLESELKYSEAARPMLEAERRASPGLAAAEYRINGVLNGLGPSRLETLLEQSAYEDLMAGRSLTGEQQRDAEQSARAAMSARGLATGQSGVMAEILNRDTFASAREAQRRSYAAGVEGMIRNRQQSDMALAQSGFNFINANFNPRGQLYGTQDSLSKNRSTPLTFFNQINPYIAGMGNTNVQSATAYNAQQLGGALQLAGFQHDLGMTLLNARFNNDIGAANNAAAADAGKKAATGQIAGAAIGAVAIIF